MAAKDLEHYGYYGFRRDVAEVLAARTQWVTGDVLRAYAAVLQEWSVQVTASRVTERHVMEVAARWLRDYMTARVVNQMIAIPVEDD